MHRIVVLGGGTAGTLVANRLRRRYDTSKLMITVVDQDDHHVYQPGLLYVPFGLANVADLVRPRARQLRSGITFHRSSVDHVDVAAHEVYLADGSTLGYDVLVVASGARLAPDETDGLTGPGWMERVFTFYTPEGASALAARLATFDRGRLIVNVVDMPIKCPVAPLEFCFLADWSFREHGLREQVEITYVTPLDGAFTRPVASRRLGAMMASKGIAMVTGFNTGTVDGRAGRLTSYDDHEVDFDLAVVVPLHAGAEYVGRSPGLGDALDFVPTDRCTLQAKANPNIFVVGDASDLPASKAGSVAHFQGEVVVANIGRHLTGAALAGDFDGHTNCFVETGFGKALLVDFNYATEPLPGHYPSRIGLPLLEETRLNHIAKRMFEWVYWHTLLPGRSVPGVCATMPRAGKDFAVAASSKEE